MGGCSEATLYNTRIVSSLIPKLLLRKLEVDLSRPMGWANRFEKDSIFIS
jgi:hypothetical protein